MIDRLNSLRHHRIISCDHKNNDIRHLRPARPHRCKGGVTWCVEETQYRTTGSFDLIRPDMLGNSPGFARDNLGVANGIKQRRFAVVDMAHDGDDGRPQI